MAKDHEGGCLCGAVRYRVAGDAVVTAWCHCTICRRSAGAPAVAWAMFPIDGFAYTAGKPGVYESTPGVSRTFCAACGTPLACTGPNLPGLVDLTTASLDDPAAFAPKVHIFESRRIPWVHLGDDLPRFAEFPPGPPPAPPGE
jgi:hypothetical protein